MLFWIFILTITLHSILNVEGKKSKKQIEEIEDDVASSEKKTRVKLGKSNKYSSSEGNSQEIPEMKYKLSKTKENSKKNKDKKKEIIQQAWDNENEKINGGKKLDFKRNKAKTKNKEYSTEEYSTISDKKRKTRKTRQEIEPSSENDAELSCEMEKKLKKKSKKQHVNSDYSEENEAETEDNRKLQHFKESEGERRKFVARKKNTPTKQEESEEEEVPSIEYATDEMDTEVEDFCRKKGEEVENCGDNDESDGNMTEETEEEIPPAKKIKYSKKFAHEKASKKNRNKEAESILKLHRKAETNMKNTKTSKTIKK